MQVVGNIIKLVDEGGNDIVKYEYDEYGKVRKTMCVTSTDEGYIVALYNGFIYKGYYYDVETGLFMMGNRYYSLELCRFIQPADVSALKPSSINGLNLYSYANNNPIGIAYSSSSAGFGLDVGYIAVTSYLSYKAGDLLAKGAVVLGALVGGIPGGIIVVVGIVAGTVLIAVISDALDNWWEEKKEEWFN